MATTVNLTTTYAGEVAGGYITPAITASESIASFTMRNKVAYKEVVRRLVSDITFADLTCDFTANGAVTLSERILEVKGLQHQDQLCKNTFLTDWEAKTAQDGNMPSAGEAFVDRILAGSATRLEYLVWEGIVGAGQFDGLMTMFDADASVNKVASPVAITSSNVIAELKRLRAESPTAVKKSAEKPKIWMAYNVWEAYSDSQIDNGNGNGWYTNQGAEPKKMWNGYEIVIAYGMRDNGMVMAQASNIWFGTNEESQLNSVNVLDMADKDLSKNVRYDITLFAGVQYGFSDEIAVYGPGIS